jgi:hypothetical protein
MPLSDFVTVQISIDSIGIALAGFGVPVILSANASFAPRIQFYSSLADVAVDFAATTPEYLAAQNLFAQDNTISLIAIGRLENKPTMQYELIVNTLTDSTNYKVRARGPGITDTTCTAASGVSTTEEITHNALATALNAVVGKNFTATFVPLTFADATFTADNATEIFTIASHGLFTGDGPFQVSNSGGALPAGLTALTDYYIIKASASTFKLATSRANAFAGTNLLITTDGTGTQTLSDVALTTSPHDGVRVTGDAAGNWFSLEVLDTTGENTSLATRYLSNAMVHADPGTATDLDNILAEDSSWYASYHLYPSKAVALAQMAWTEAQPRICIVDTCESHTITASAGGSDVGDTAKASSYDRTLLEYHPSPIDFLGPALMGQVLPLEPGAETWAFKSNLSGPRGVKLSSTHRVNLRARNMNTYEPQTDDITWTWDGKTPGGEYLDTTRGLDKVKDDVTKSIASVLASNPKVPYTDGGALRLGNELRGAIARAVTAGIAAEDPAPTFVIPRAATQSAANRAIRRFAGMKAGFTLASAIQNLPITIVVTQ